MTAPADQTRTDIPARGVERALARQRQKYQDEVERLIEAAFAVMRTRDTAAPTVNDILAEAGMSTTAFYRHFPTKDDLLLTLLERAHASTRAHLQQLLVAESDPERRIGAWITGMFDFLRTPELVGANRPLLLAHPHLLERFPVEIKGWAAALTHLLAEAIGDARAARGLPPDTAVTDAPLVYAQVYGILIDHAAERRIIDNETIAQVTNYTLNAVLGTR
jgi:AcrR family transcriptional regulator